MIPTIRRRGRCALLAMAALAGMGMSEGRAYAAEDRLVIEGKDGPGKGKHVVLVSGDEEYRSEEGLTQLAKILAAHHGFKCTVLFAVNPKDGTIDPNQGDNIPGLEALDHADLMILLTRFRHLPDAQMKHIADYVESGRPIVGLRTATHAFDNKNGPYARFGWTSKEPGWEGGFGRRVLGETWINHHGAHGSQSTRGILAPGAAGSPILKGISDGEIWGPTDVYEVRLPLTGDAVPLVLGEVLEGMKPDAKPLPGPKNHPMMPVAWTRTYTPEGGKPARIFNTTMGSSTDLQNEALRRLLVNAAYWATGLEGQIPDRSKVDLVGTYEPLPFGNNKFKKAVKPADLAGE
ncbi:ThuA domain-containing protein [Isosphaeraceae bacterium EP7]